MTLRTRNCLIAVILLLSLSAISFVIGFRKPAQAQTAQVETVSFQASVTPEPRFTCGAITKQGTPCKRRVKVQGTHCFMHK